MNARILPDTERPSGADARRGIEHATTIAIESFSRCFRELCPRIEDELFTRAQEESDRTRQMHMLDAYGLVRANRDQIEQQFRRAIEAIVRERSNPHAARAATEAAKAAIDSTSLSLVDDGELEADVIVKRMVGRLRSVEGANHNEVVDLDDRLNYLLGRETTDDASNPFSPDALCRAIQRACDEIDTHDDVRNEILRRIERLLAPGFAPAYRDLNAYFCRMNVLPDLARFRKQRSAQRSGQHSALRTTPQASRVDTRSAMPAPLNAPAAPVATASHDFVERFAARRSGVPGHARSDGARATMPPPAGGWPVIHGAAIDHLHEFLPAQTVFAEPTTFATAPLPQLNMLHAVGRNARSRGVPRDEEILIDLVALVVDHILLDAQVPERIKRLIARLQVPLLRCALLDRSLFSRPEHPARVLLDAIARASVGWTSSDGAHDDVEDRYYQLVFDIVVTIETAFDRDLDLFDTQRLRLEDFLAERARIEAERYARAAEAIEQAELREIADQQALLQIRDAITDVEIPESIAEFLLDPWRRVLVEASVTGADNEVVLPLRKAITDVVWSVQPKIDVDERQRLLAMLPALIKTIREGFRAIGLASEEQARFFNDLMLAHASAVKVAVRSEQGERAFARFESRVNDLRIDPQAAPAHLAVDVPAEALARAVQSSDVTIEVAHAPMPDIARHAVHTHDDVETIVASMTRGTWAEVADRDPHKVARLRWISPRRSTYLFTNRTGTEAISYTAELLRLHVEIGHLLVLQAKELTERALDAIEASLAPA